MEKEDLLAHGHYSTVSNHPEHYPAPMNDPRVLLVARVPKINSPIESILLEDKRWMLENAPNGTVFTIFWPGAKKSTSRYFHTKAQRNEWIEYIDKKYF